MLRLHLTPQRTLFLSKRCYTTLGSLKFGQTRILTLDTPIRYLPKVGEKRFTLLQLHLGVKTIRDLLEFYPRKYIEQHHIELSQVSDEYINQKITVCGTITKIQRIYLKKSPSNFIYIARLQDGDKHVDCYFFQLGIVHARQFVQGRSYLVTGFLRKFKNGEIGIAQPDYEEIANIEETRSDANMPILPVYPTVGELKKRGIGLKTMRFYMHTVLKESLLKIDDPMPEWIKEKYNLMDIREAFTQVHIPTNLESLQRAQFTLKFQEFLYMQIYFEKLRRSRQILEERDCTFKGMGEKTKQFLSSLPYELTKGQKAAIDDILNDVTSGKRMNRLLQGDVGCGKTVVAVVSLLLAVDSGYQGLFIAPTEVLAEQHYAYLHETLKPLGVNVVILVGGQKPQERNEVLKQLADGTAHICVGTHAILSEKSVFKNIGLSVIDEFCKFGVAQRGIVLEKGSLHLMLMSATPIPRSLSMVLYGDLNVTIIPDVPSDRKPVKTTIVREKDRFKMHQFLLEQLEKGHQAYIVCPLVNPSEKLDLKNAETLYEELQKDPKFSKYKIGLVHGQMHWYVKEQEMLAFKNKKYDILVATTVIEVGIDVANATVMIIENAERYGLSQLHQLRGRVGRGAAQSYCIMMVKDDYDEENNGTSAKQRLETICQTNDGFKISEMDLKIRGSGDLVGTQQSGFVKSFLKISTLEEDAEILYKAKKAVEDLFQIDPSLDNPEHFALKKEYERLSKTWNYGIIA